MEAKGVTEDELKEAREEVTELRKREGIKLSTIYFSFDDYSLSEQAKKTLIENAAWLTNNPQKRLSLKDTVMNAGQKSTT